VTPDDVPPFLRFTPVPVRPQRNGWTPELQRRFILALAQGAGPDAAAQSLGRTRQSVYRLRARPDASSFAAAWDRALDFAREARAASDCPTSRFAGAQTLLVPRYYRGRLIGFIQREDAPGLWQTLAHLKQLGGAFPRNEARRGRERK
jgi:hypothetical protein